jgi:hypothetical protein
MIPLEEGGGEVHLTYLPKGIVSGNCNTREVLKFYRRHNGCVPCDLVEWEGVDGEVKT